MNRSPSFPKSLVYISTLICTFLQRAFHIAFIRNSYPWRVKGDRVDTLQSAYDLRLLTTFHKGIHSCINFKLQVLLRSRHLMYSSAEICFCRKDLGLQYTDPRDISQSLYTDKVMQHTAIGMKLRQLLPFFPSSFSRFPSCSSLCVKNHAKVSITICMVQMVVAW